MDQSLWRNFVEPSKIFVYGASGHGKVIADIILAMGHQFGGWIDDRILPHSQTWKSFCKNNTTAKLALGIGDNLARSKIAQKILDKGFELPILIHPSAIISSSALLDLGTVVMPLAVVNADSRIGKGCIINTGSIVEHDCELANFIHISPKAALAGGVKVGSYTHIGMGSNIIQNLSIENNCLISAGSTVIRNIDAFSMVAGTPALLKKKLPKQI